MQRPTGIASLMPSFFLSLSSPYFFIPPYLFLPTIHLIHHVPRASPSPASISHGISLSRKKKSTLDFNLDLLQYVDSACAAAITQYILCDLTSPCILYTTHSHTINEETHLCGVQCLCVLYVCVYLFLFSARLYHNLIPPPICSQRRAGE